MHLSFKQRIMAAVVLAALVPMCVIGAITAYMGFDNSRNLSEAGLASVQSATALRLHDYVSTLNAQVSERAEGMTAHNALKDLAAGVEDFNAAGVAVDKAQLKARYVQTQEKTSGTTVADVDNWMPKNQTALALQQLYIAGNPNKVGEKQKLDMAKDGSAYSAAHAKYHESFRRFVEKFGLYDAFLIDAASGRVVYSDAKEIDYMSSVKDGAFADTNFSRVVKQALASTDQDAVFMSDIQPYLPSNNEAAMFVAAPIVEDGATVGAFAIQVPIDRINGVFEPLKKLGNSVDGFVAGPDLTFRTPQTAESGKVGEKVNPSLAVTLGKVFASKKNGIAYYNGEDGGPMTGSFQILDLPGVSWVLVVGQDNAEMLESSYHQLYILGGIMVTAVLLTLVFGWVLGSGLSGPVVKLGRGFNSSTEKVGRSTGLVGDAVASMIAASEETSAQSTVVRRNSTEAAGYVGSVSSAVEELNTSIHDISQSIHETNILVDDAVSKAQHTDEVVRKLGEASTRITEVVGLINDLAAQTNLLALNAAIEAARAGDAGRGFAVVADEVKKLATHTTQATVDIGAQVHEIQEVTQQSVVALQAVVQAIHRIRDNATAVSAAVEEQSGVARQISTNVRDAAVRVQQVDENMTGIEQAANDTGVAADQVNLSVTEVQGAFSEMKSQMQRVLDDMGVKV